MVESMKLISYLHISKLIINGAVCLYSACLRGFQKENLALFKDLREKKQYLLECGSKTEMLEVALSVRF